MSATDTTPSVPPASANEASGAEKTSSPAASSSAATRIIKRYSNRKLYDTVESRYVTLPQIALLVRRGEEVRIIDNTSKEDLTSVTLAQILYEEERKQSRALPLAALKDLIHTSGEKIITSLRESPMGKFIPARDGADGSPADGTAGTNEPGSTSSAGTRPGENAPATAAAKDKLAGMFEQSRGSIQEWQHRVDEQVRTVLEKLVPERQVERLQAEIRKLTERLEQLESKLGHTHTPSSTDGDNANGSTRE